MQLGIEQALGPRTILGQTKPTLLWVMHKRGIRREGAQVKMRPKIIGGQAFNKLTQGTGQTRHARGAFAVGKQGGAIAVANMDRPNTIDGVEPTLLLDVKPHRLQLGLKGIDGGFEWRVFAKNETLSGHVCSLIKTAGAP